MAVSTTVDALVKEASVNKKIHGAIYLGITLSEPAVEERATVPELVPLPHKFRRSEDQHVCLVVKDPQHKVISVLNDDPRTLGLFDEVIGVGKLRRRLKSKKAVDEFAKTFAYIFVQEQVRQPLAQVLGPHFYKTARSLPIPVILSTSTDKEKQVDTLLIKTQVRQALKASQIILKPSTYISVLVGHTKMDPEKLKSNVRAARKFAESRFQRPHLHIKSPESAALPL